MSQALPCDVCSMLPTKAASTLPHKYPGSFHYTLYTYKVYGEALNHINDPVPLSIFGNCLGGCKWL